jgi:O-antigen/teichoic acid export membrane protein
VRRKTSFGGDVLRLVSGTIFAQLLSVLAAPFLTRLYAPEAFGLSALFASITTIIVVVACFRYELAIMLPPSDEEATSILGTSLASVLLVSLLSVLIVWRGREPLLRVLKAGELGPYLWLLPPSVLVAGVFLALNYWNSRTKHFQRLSIAQVTSSVTTVGTQIGLGAAGAATGGSLIGANFIGSAVSTFVLGGQIWRDDGPLLRRGIRRQSVVAAARRYRKFALYGTPSALLNSISWQLPTLLLQVFFSSTVVGFYALGNRLLRLPMSLIGGAIGRVFFQRAAEAKASGSLAGLVENAFRYLVMLSFFPMLLLTVVGRDLFIVVFGQHWGEAGVYVQILSVWTAFWFISSPLSTLFSVLERQEFGLKLNLVIFGSRFLSLWAGGRLGDARLALVLFAVSGVFLYGYMSLAIMAAAGVPWSRMAQILFDNFALFLPAGVVLVALGFAQVSAWVRVGAAGLLGLAYFVYIVRREPELRKIAGRARAERS